MSGLQILVTGSRDWTDEHVIRNAGYVAHRTAGEAACDACRAACSAYQRARYAKDSSDVKARQAARQAARTRLVDAHRDEYRRYYAEELARLRETP
jgi:hypothetical protein